MGQLVLLEILLDDFRILVPGVDRENDESVLFVLVGDTRQVRSLRTAGRSAIGEEREQHGLAAKVAELDGSSVQRLE